jgi:23S rRNA pseudouridine2605 synthase
MACAPGLTYDGRVTDQTLFPPGGERIAKALARAGICSRRDAERLIAEGRVAVNGRVLDGPAVKVVPEDEVRVDGKRVREPEPTRLWRYHKPAGLVTTTRDPDGRPTVFQRLPQDLPRVVSVGRLDLNSEGLLLLTNDGALSRRLELPASGFERTYRARAFGRVEQAELDRLAVGAVVEGVPYGPIRAELERQQGGNAWIAVTLAEGKNREVRRVLDSLGLKVNRLIRTHYGPFELGDLKSGQVDEVPPRVTRRLFGPSKRPERTRRSEDQAGG